MTFVKKQKRKNKNGEFSTKVLAKRKDSLAGFKFTENNWHIFFIESQ